MGQPSQKRAFSVVQLLFQVFRFHFQTKGRLEPHELVEEHMLLEVLSEKYVITSENGRYLRVCVIITVHSQ